MFAELRVPGTGRQDLHGSQDDERKERTRSVPSVASRRVAAPYGVDDLALKRSISSQKVLNFKARYARQSHPCLRRARYARWEQDDGHPSACKFCSPVTPTSRVVNAV